MLKAEVILCFSFKIIAARGAGWAEVEGTTTRRLNLKPLKQAGVNMEHDRTLFSPLHISGFFYDKNKID